MATLQPVSQGPQGSSNDVEMDDFEIDLNMVGSGTPMMQDNLELDDDIQEFDADLPDAQSYRNSASQSPRSVAMENDDVGLMTNPGLVEDISDLPDLETADAIDTHYDQPIHFDPHDVIPDIHVEEPSEPLGAINNDHDQLVEVRTMSTPAIEQHTLETDPSHTQPQAQEADNQSYDTTDNANESFPTLEFTANEDAEGLDTTQTHEPQITEESIPTLLPEDNDVEDPRVFKHSYADGHDDPSGSLDTAAQLETKSDTHDHPSPRIESSDDVANREDHASLHEDANTCQTQDISDNHNSPENTGEAARRHSATPEKQQTGPLHPVLVSWEDQKDWLLQPNPDEDYQGFYLQNANFAFQGYPVLFQALRGALEDAIGSDEEILIEVPVFDITIHEDSCDENSSLAEIVNIFVNLEVNDGKQSPEPFEIFLTKRVRFSHRLLQLKNAAASALGRSQCDFLHGIATANSSDYTNENDEQPSRQSPDEHGDVRDDSESSGPAEDSEDPRGGSGDQYDETQDQEEFAENDALQVHDDGSNDGNEQEHVDFETDQQREYADTNQQSERGGSPQQVHEEASRDNDWEGNTQRPESPVAGLDDTTEHVEIVDQPVNIEQKQSDGFDPFEAPSLLPNPELEAAVNEAFPDTSLDVAHNELDEHFDLIGYGNDFYPGNEDFDESTLAQPEPVSFDGGVADNEAQSSLTEPALPDSQDKKENADEPYALADDDLIDYDDDDEDDQVSEPVIQTQPPSTSSTATIQGDDVELEKLQPTQPQSQHDAANESPPNKRNREPSEDVQSNIPEPKRRKSG